MMSELAIPVCPGAHEWKWPIARFRLLIAYSSTFLLGAAPQKQICLRQISLALHVDSRNIASLLIGNRFVDNDKNDSFMIKEKS